jgi:hypothetical protein
MNTQALTKTNGENQIDMKAQITFGRKALQELRVLIRNRPDPVVINNKRYLEFIDWQILGSFFGITAFVESTEEILEELPPKDGAPFTFKRVIGFKARAKAIKDGNVMSPLSAAEAECMFEEKNWQNKPRFTLRSMAETRACSKALRNVLQWVVKLPDEKTGKVVEEFGDVAAEETDDGKLL